MKLNENIRNFRKFRNMNQAELAAKISKSKSVISHWESGENSPDLDSCEKLCQVLNVTPNQLFGWEENPEYIRYLKNLEEYNKEMDSLYRQREKIQKQIEILEQKKFDQIAHFVDDE